MTTRPTNSILVLLLAGVQLALASASYSAIVPAVPAGSRVLTINPGDSATTPNYRYDDTTIPNVGGAPCAAILPAHYAYDSPAPKASSAPIRWYDQRTFAAGNNTDNPQLLTRPPPSDASTTIGDFSVAPRSVVTRTTRQGESAVRITRADGTVVDISPQRVKEFVPNTHPKAPPGTLQKVKFKDSLPGSKGFKRTPTAEELELLKKLTEGGG